VDTIDPQKRVQLHVPSRSQQLAHCCDVRTIKHDQEKEYQLPLRDRSSSNHNSQPNTLQETRTIKHEQQNAYACHRDTKSYVKSCAIDTHIAASTHRCILEGIAIPANCRKRRFNKVCGIIIPAEKKKTKSPRTIQAKSNQFHLIIEKSAMQKQKKSPSSQCPRHQSTNHNDHFLASINLYSSSHPRPRPLPRLPVCDPPHATLAHYPRPASGSSVG
jgi:hypothetical protein